MPQIYMNMFVHFILYKHILQLEIQRKWSTGNDWRGTIDRKDIVWNMQKNEYNYMKRTKKW